MKFQVFIRDNATGEIRECDVNEFDSEFQALYRYSDGNYSCDCNRRAFFDANLDDLGCGNTEYAVRVLREDGTEIYSDFDGRPE